MTQMIGIRLDDEMDALLTALYLLSAREDDAMGAKLPPVRARTGGARPCMTGGKG